MMKTKQSICRLIYQNQRSSSSSFNSISPSSSTSSKCSTPTRRISTETLSRSDIVGQSPFSTSSSRQGNMHNTDWSGFERQLRSRIEHLLTDSGRSHPWMQFLLVVARTMQLDPFIEKIAQVAYRLVFPFSRLGQFGIVKNYLIGKSFRKSNAPAVSPSVLLFEANQWTVHSKVWESDQLLSPATVKAVEVEGEESGEWGHFADFQEETSEEQIGGFLGPAFQPETLDMVEESEESEEEPEDLLSW